MDKPALNGDPHWKIRGFLIDKEKKLTLQNLDFSAHYDIGPDSPAPEHTVIMKLVLKPFQ